ncbi:hypothetical protein F2P81_011228 [Scophthalmus maximus]|uniref:Uncharacterized protein n=1 Tax=Scophthalmus maximus TaxID=52904 RepID=A0A6A4SL20_SCOMX|nr:hypothetical protein F2P81_011228 [Scophthalmus maximus]
MTSLEMSDVVIVSDDVGTERLHQHRGLPAADVTHRADYLKECRKCTLLRFSFSGLCDAMWENSLKMSRYVASPDEENNGEKNEENDGPSP